MNQEMLDTCYSLDELYLQRYDWVNEKMASTDQVGVHNLLNSTKMDNYFFSDELNVQTSQPQMHPQMQQQSIPQIQIDDMLNMKFTSDPFYFNTPLMNLGVESNITPNTSASSMEINGDANMDNIWGEIQEFSPYSSTDTGDFGFSPFEEMPSLPFQNARPRSNSSLSLYDSFDQSQLSPKKRQRSASNPTVDKKKKVFYCHLCPTTFSRNHDLKRHIRIHLGIRPHKCQTCPKSFTRADALHRHVNVRGCRGV